MLEVHGVSKPARSVSGDYYDFLLTGPLQLCLALGDISGKGISAALLMASLHSAVRAYRFGDSGPGSLMADGEPNMLASPALMLERLNRHLFTSTQPEKYATLFLAYYDGTDRTLTYSTGGQLPPLVLCANGEVKRLDCGGSVVGLLDGMKYDQATVTLGAGDILIIYSDGVTEPENEFGDFGEDRLLDLVRQNRTQSLEAISSTVMQSLRGWIGDQEQPDDITLVLARQL
jgi:sigma-B regulation protein RsbU (phosphoserine phosphatase)